MALDPTLIDQINTPVVGGNGANINPQDAGYAGGNALPATDLVSGDSFFDPSASLFLTPSVTGGNGGMGSGGASGGGAAPLEFYTSAGILEVDYYGDFNGGIGGAGGIAGWAELDIDDDTVGSAAEPLGGSSTINGTAIGGNGAAGSGGYSGGYGGYTGALYYPIGELIEGAPGGAGGDGGAGSDGGAAISSAAGLAETVTAAAVVDLTGTGGAGAQGGAGGEGGQGGAPSDGGQGGSGGNGGKATASLSGSSITSFRSITITLTATGGAGGTGGLGGISGLGTNGGDHYAYGVGGNYIPFTATITNGDAGNGGVGGDGGAAVVDFTSNTLTAPNVLLSFTASGGAPGTGGAGGSIFVPFSGQTEDSEGNLYNYFSPPPGGMGNAGNSVAGQIDFTGNTITVTGTLSLTLHSEATFSGLETLEPLIGASGGNLVFSANSFAGDGSSELDLQGSGSNVTVDDLANTISIAGSPANAMTGFDTYVLGSNDTFIRGSSAAAVIFVAPDPDTIELLPGHGPTVIYNSTTANTVLEFDGYGSAPQANIVAEPDGSTAINIPGDGPVTLLQSSWTPSVSDTNLPGTGGGGGTPTVDTFSNVSVATSGPFEGSWLWTTPANWSVGVPINGDSVINKGDFAVDAIPSLVLASLTLDDDYPLSVEQADLTVDALVFGGASFVYVTSGATLTIGGPVTGPGGRLYANGAGAVINDLAPSDPGALYGVANYGTLILAAPLAPAVDGSELNYDVDGSGTPGTFVLLDPGTTIDADLTGIAPGDVLELPGTEVQNVTFDNTEFGDHFGFLSVTTNAGSFDFSRAEYGPGVAGYTAAVDPATGLVAITFTAGDAFNDNSAQTSGTYAGGYMWSNAANWAPGIPVNGADVYVYADAYADIAGLTLASVGVTDRDWLDVIANLTIDALSLGPLSTVYVDGTTTLTIQGPVIAAPGELFGGLLYGEPFEADNSGAVLVDNAPVDPGATYEAIDGGMIILAATPSAASVLSYDSRYPTGVLALPNPGSTITTPLENVGTGDVLELPGSLVDNVSANGSALTITTDAGVFYFSDVSFANTVSGYTQTVDPVTDLVAITFNNGSNVVAGTPTIAAGTSLTLSGSQEFAAGTSLVNDGLLILDNAVLTDDGVLTNNGNVALDPSTAVLASLTGAGTITAGAGSTLDLAAVTGTQTVQLGAGADSLGVQAGGNSVQLSGLDTPGAAVFAALGATTIQGGGNQPTSFMVGAGSDTVSVNQQGGVLNVQAASAAVMPLDLTVLGGLASLDLGAGAASIGMSQGLSTVDFSGLDAAGGAASVSLGMGPAATGVQAGGTGPILVNVGTGSASVGITQLGGLLNVQAPDAADAPVVLSVFSGMASLDLGPGASSITLSQGGSTVGMSGLNAAGGTAFVVLGTGAAATTIQGGGNVPTMITAGAGNDSISLNLDNAPAIVDLGSTAAMVTTEGTADPPQDIIYIGTGSDTLVGGGSATTDYVFSNGSAPTVVIENFDISTTSLTLLNFPDGASTGLLTGAVSAGGSTSVALPDGTQITFADVSSLTGLQVSTEVPCFAAGTRIGTPGGELAVESLRAGDYVLSAFGGVVPVVWVGHRHVQCRRHPRPELVWPVRVAAGAFAPGRPRRDLWLSPDHAVFVEGDGEGAAPGVLIPVKYLLNGASIVQVARDEISYYHLELGRHEVLLAEGLPAESYLDTGNRGAFANGGKLTVMHPDFALRVWDGSACAALVLSGPRLQAARRRLIDRLPELGHPTTEDPALCVAADGVVLEPQRYGAWLCVALPDGASRLRLRSRRVAPSELDAASDDTRRLGVAVQALTFDGVHVALDDARLTGGWHGSERGLRWTDGDGCLDVAGISVVELCLAPPLLRYHERVALAA